MKLKIYKASALFIALTFAGLTTFAQTAVAVPATPPKPASKTDLSFNVNLNKLNNMLASINTNINNAVLTNINKNINNNINKNINTINGEIISSLNGLTESLSAINCDVNVNTDNVETAVTDGDTEELTKTYSKSYSADANDILDIDNRYGKVTVVTWNKNEFKVDVLIKVATNKEGAAKKMLDDVTIQDGKQGATVWFKTRFAGDQGSSSWSFNGKKTVRIMEINYTIHMPAKNALSVTNKYGSTELPDLYGRVVVNAAYGNLAAKNLPNPANQINVKYGSASIEGLSGCDLNVAYGNLSLNESEKVNANVSYGAAKIGYVKTSGVFNIKYSGGLNIVGVDKNLKNLVVNSSYSGVKVSLPDALNLDFDVTVHYGNFDYGNAVNVVNNDQGDEKGWKPTKNFKGSVGKGNSDKVIVIKSNYGNVKFE